MPDLTPLLTGILSIERTVKLILLSLAESVQIPMLTAKTISPGDIGGAPGLVHASIGADGISSPLLGLCIFREEQELQDCEQAYH